MLATQLKILARLGEGTTAAGCNSAKDETGKDFYFIALKSLNAPKKIGDKIELSECESDQEIILTFPTENQMLKVMAAFTNKSFEEMVDNWMARKLKEAEKETMSWKVELEEKNND